MPSDPPTFFLVLVVSTLMGSLLLLWCWSQNRADRTLLWCSAAYAFASAGNILLMRRHAISDLLSIDLAISLTLFGFSLAWVAGRVFNGRRVRHEAPFVGPAVWLLACRVPAFHGSYEARVVLAALIAATYGLLAAREFWARDGLASRYPIAIALFVHSAMVVLRIPLVIAEMGKRPTVPFTSPSFDLMALEALIFAQAIAFLVVSLTKERLEAQLRTAALTDPLTGLSNRRALFACGAAVIGQSARHRRPTSVVVFDLDRFKEVNDTYGHPIGDAVIRRFSTAARATLRMGVHIGRIGGEEFAAILPDTDNEQACVAARRLMTTFADLAVNVEGCRTEATASAGVATSQDGKQSLEELLGAADRALYESKRRGRDSLRAASTTPMPSIALSRAS
jgi:diguanylate cyclase (GGDEF)-like protein